VRKARAVRFSFQAGSLPARVHNLLQQQPNKRFAVVSSVQLARELGRDFPGVDDREMVRRCGAALRAGVLKVEVIGVVLAWTLGDASCVEVIQQEASCAV
jgi:hypothetical protein